MFLDTTCKSFEIFERMPNNTLVPRSVEILPTLGLVSRQSLILHARSDHPDTADEWDEWNISFSRWDEPKIYSPYFHQRYMAETVAEYMSQLGRPRPLWHNLASLLPYLLPLALAITWIACSINVNFSPIIHLFGWLVTAGSVAIAFLLRRALRPEPPRVQGHRIRQGSREKNQERRANTRRDIKVGIITALGSVVATFVIALLSGLFKFRL